jgi:predicted phage gp36 major capsid-like protein
MMQYATGPRVPDTDGGLERIKRLEQQLAREPARSSGRRELTEVVHIEADLYRKSLDEQQAAATRTMQRERATEHLI